jgi:hypothetical protein
MKTITTGKSKFNSNSLHIFKLQFKNCVTTKSETEKIGIFISITGKGRKTHTERKEVLCV